MNIRERRRDQALEMKRLRRTLGVTAIHGIRNRDTRARYRYWISLAYGETKEFWSGLKRIEEKKKYLPKQTKDEGDRAGWRFIPVKRWTERITKLFEKRGRALGTGEIKIYIYNCGDEGHWSLKWSGRGLWNSIKHYRTFLFQRSE